MTTKSVSVFFTRSLAIFAVVTLVSGSMPLRADPTDTSQPPVSEGSDQPAAEAPAQPATPPMSPDQLDTLVAPVALYPDPLISQVLVASTYPLELVQANQWLQQNPNLKGQDLKDAAAKQSWDPSIQALVLFPDIIKRLNEDVTWTTNLGNQVLVSQAAVMDAIQRMRVKAEQAGKLKSTPQENVTTTEQSGQQVVEIQPADPEVVYVPQYNPVWIWGPPAYYYYPPWYYPPPPPFGVWFFWGPAFRMSFFFPGWVGYGGWGWWGWHPGWYNHSVIVNRTFVTYNHFNVVNVHGGNVWVHNPYHRMGVAYPNHALAQHYNAVAARQGFAGHPGGVAPRPTASQLQQQFHQRAMSPEGSTQRLGNRQIAAPNAFQNHSAFGGTEHGANARTYSNRGRASLGHVKPAKVKMNKGQSRGGDKQQGGGRL